MPRSRTARELDLLVAAQARVRRAAGGVLADEVLDDVLVEAVAEVPDVERDADHVGRPARVVGVLDRAAAAGAAAVGLRVAREGQVDAGDVVALLDRAGRRDGRVDAARHRCQDAHQRCVPARQCGAAGPLHDRRDGARRARRRRPARRCGPARTAARPRAASVRGPHRQQHVRGLRHAGVAGRPGRALDAARVEQHQQRVALAAGERQVRVAGQPLHRVAVVDRVGHLLEHARAPGARAAAASRSASSGWRRTATSQATAKPAMAGGSIVPERMSRSWPPPCSSGGRLQLPAHDERADAVRPADLVAGDGHRVDPAARRSRAAAGPAPGRRRCARGCRGRGRSRRARRWAAPCRPRCWPTSPRPPRRSRDRPRGSPGRRPTSMRPSAVDRRPARPWRPRRPASAAGRGRRGARPACSGSAAGAGPRRGGPRTAP